MPQPRPTAGIMGRVIPTLLTLTLVLEAEGGPSDSLIPCPTSESPEQEQGPGCLRLSWMMVYSGVLGAAPAHPHPHMQSLLRVGGQVGTWPAPASPPTPKTGFARARDTLP